MSLIENKKKTSVPYLYTATIPFFSAPLWGKCPQKICTHLYFIFLELTLIRICFQAFTKYFPDLITNKLDIANSIDLIFYLF